MKIILKKRPLFEKVMKEARRYLVKVIMRDYQKEEGFHEKDFNHHDEVRKVQKADRNHESTPSGD